MADEPFINGNVAPVAAGDFVIIRGGGIMLVCEAAIGQRPVILFCGPDMAVSGEELALLTTGQHAQGGPAKPLRASLLSEWGTGISGPSGLIAHHSGEDWATDLRIEKITQHSSNHVDIECADKAANIRTLHVLTIDSGSGVLSLSSRITNISPKPLSVEWCSAAVLPLDPRFTRLLGFSGKWASEFQVEEIALFRGGYIRENKSGRTSHDNFPGLYAGTDTTCEDSGLAAAFHLAWSGNSRVRVDCSQGGAASVQMGELLLPGEIQLGPDESYHTPVLKACWSKLGYSDLSQRLHRHLESSILGKRIFDRPRPVHYNTWEAVYFDHSESRLLDLADKAAEVGAERFVLDDGWFGGRRNDSAGLGDWWVSPEVYPGGLHPIVNRVRALGMQFGLWFEPEMVNPDSDLYRNHPSWILAAPGVDIISSRNQYTLDLTQQAVTDYLFEKMALLVAEYSIDYIKWDMNRDTHFPGSKGRGAMHRQTNAVYHLIAKLRAAFPTLEIESCSSGGARADYGILRHTDRVWTSDNNDARHRQHIQRGASYFLPLRVTGSHVGPQKCHITGRIFSMEFRAASAIFGHMGMELDLAKESPEDRAILARAIALHKRHRDLIHGGRLHRLDTAPSMLAMGVVAQDRAEALFSCALLDMLVETRPPQLRFTGIDPVKSYRIKLIWPDRNISVSSPSILEAANLLGTGTIFSGAALMEYGIQMPLIMPDNCLIYHLKAEN